MSLRRMLRVLGRVRAREERGSPPFSEDPAGERAGRADAAAAAPGPGPARDTTPDRADRDREQPVPAEGDAAVLRLDEAGRALRRAQAARGLQAAVGHRLPRRPAHRGGRRAARQAGHVLRDRAAPDPDRRLPRQQGAHPEHDRRRAQEARRAGQDGQLLRPRQGAQGRGDHQGDAGGEGLSLRQRQARGQEHRRLGPAAVVRDRPGAEGQGARDRLRRQPGLQRRQAARQDEEGQAAGLLQPELARRQDHLHRGQVARRPGGPARRPRPDRGLLPRQRLRDGARRPAAHQLQRRQVRLLQEEAGQADEARGPGDRRRTSTRWASSSSRGSRC